MAAWLQPDVGLHLTGQQVLQGCAIGCGGVVGGWVGGLGCFWFKSQCRAVVGGIPLPHGVEVPAQTALEESLVEAGSGHSFAVLAVGIVLAWVGVDGCVV